MSRLQDHAALIVSTAKDNYNFRLREADKLLEAEVARDSSQLSACRAIQATYAAGLGGLTRLLPAMQDRPSAVELAMCGDTAPVAVLA